MDNELMENTKAKMLWAEKYIEEFRKKGVFDPFTMLMNTETKDQKLFGICVQYLEDIKEATERFEKSRNKIAFRG